MRVHTVAGLAALGMLLTSYTVWSWSPDPQIGPEVAEDDPVVDTPTLVATNPQAERWKFRVGDTLTLEGRLGNSVLQSGKDSETFLFLDVRADASKLARVSAPMNLAIAIDRSGSMKGKRLQNALDAARGMIRRMRDGDALSIVAYNTTTEVVLPTTTIDPLSRERAVASLSQIAAVGDTCISCGIESAMDALRQRSNMVDRILLLSDGEATAGVRNVEGFRNIAARCRRMGASITSIGVDVDYNERVMSALAIDSNGRHHFAENAGDLPRIFDAEFDSLVKTLAKDAQLEVTLAPGVRLDHVFDRTFRREGDKLIVPLGTFAAADQKTLLVRLNLPRGAEGERAVADVKLRYSDLSSGQGNEHGGSLIAMMTSEPAKVSPLDPVVLNRLTRAEARETLESANALFEAGKADEARRQLARKRADIAKRSLGAADKVGGSRKAELEEDFDRQVAALDDAESGFAQPPPSPAAKPAARRKAKSQVRSNAKSATDFAF